MSTKFLSPGWRMPRNANQSKSSNYSLDFDGSNVIEVPLTIDGLSSVTMSVWFKNNFDTQTNQYLLSFPRTATNNGFDINFNLQEVRSSLSGSSGNFNTLSSTFTYTDGNWHHLAVSYDGTSHKMYIDGVLTALDSVSYGTINNTTGMFYIGAFNVSGSSPVLGINATELNQVAIFDSALSDGGVSVGGTATGQIAQLYGTGSAIGNPMALPRTPIAYYPLGTSAWNGEYLAENNAIGDYVFDFSISGNGYITVPDSTALEPQNLTVSFWINAGAQSNYEYYLEKGNFSYAVYTANTTTDLKFFIYDGSSYYFSNVLTNVLDSNWHHIAFTYDGSQIIGYKDGVANTPVSASATILYDTNPLRLFSRGTASPSAHPSGKMSNAQIFNTALSATEVETLYNYGSPIRTLANIPQSSNLKAWYKLDATEIYNSSITEWSIDNNKYPSTYNSSINFNSNWMKVYPHGSGKNSSGGLTLPDTYTISWWAKTSLSSNAGFFEGENHTGGDSAAWGNIFRYNSITGGKYRLWNAGSPVDVTSDIADGKWHHILLTYDSSTTTVTVYTDNVQTFTSSSRNYGTANNIGRIGSGSDGNSYYNGNMSNISIWDGVVTTSQRDELYNNGAPKDLTNNSNYSNLKHWYIFNSQTTGTRILNDQKGSNNVLAYSGNTPYSGFVNTLAGDSSGMTQSNLVQSDLQTVAPYSKYAMNFDGTDGITIKFYSNFT